SDERQVAAHRLDVIPQPGIDQIPRIDEAPPRGLDADVDAAPVEADPDLDAHLPGERRPADVAAALMPGDPGGAPLGAGHPDPAVARILVPAAVVIDDRAPLLVGVPGPAVI